MDKAKILSGTSAGAPSKNGSAKKGWGGEPQPAEIHVFETERDAKPTTIIKCRFRPAKLAMSKAADWSNMEITPELNVPKTYYKGGHGASLSLDLFFDTTETGDDVRRDTDELLQLVLKPEDDPGKKHPPLCQFVWGKFRSFMAYVPSVDITFTMFLPDGTPVRAEARFKLEQVKEIVNPPQNPTSYSEPRKTWIVVEGERLDWIAYMEYGDPAQWRHIARANNLADPKDLRSGQVLKLMPLD